MITPAQILLLENLPNLGTVKVREIVSYLIKRRRNFPGAKKGVIRLIRDIYGPYSHNLKEAPAVEVVAEAQEKVQQILELSEKNGVRMVTYQDDLYPQALKNMPDTPLLLHYKGNLDILKRISVAVTGKDATSSYTQLNGAQVTDAFVESGFTIVSGFATGCDMLAHTVAAKRGVASVAVLAGGMDILNHPEKKAMADTILENGGLLLSAQFYGMKRKKSHAVSSCALQAGLSKGVVVLETDKEGEPMEAARGAIRQHKPLACLAPSDHESIALDMNRFTGNFKLLELKKTVALTGSDSLVKFRKQLTPQLSDKLSR